MHRGSSYRRWACSRAGEVRVFSHVQQVQEYLCGRPLAPRDGDVFMNFSPIHGISVSGVERNNEYPLGCDNISSSAFTCGVRRRHCDHMSESGD